MLPEKENLLFQVDDGLWGKGRRFLNHRSSNESTLRPKGIEWRQIFLSVKGYQEMSQGFGRNFES